MAITNKGLNKYKRRFFALLKHPFFWVLTIGGNTIVLIGSICLFFFEGQYKSPPLNFFDCLLWSTGTVTTTGYGNFTPETFSGKLTILLLMITGTLFLWSYMGFLVTGLLAPELSTLENNVHEVEKELQQLKKM